MRALANLGFLLSDQTVGNILRRHGLSPAPKRKQAISWKDFTRSHMEVLVGTIFSRPRQYFQRNHSVFLNRSAFRGSHRSRPPDTARLPVQPLP
jgi:hypothetical protein